MTKRWHVLSTLGKPKGRHETAFVECEGKFYLIGGREARGRIDQFDPDTKSWKKMRTRTPLIHHFQPIVKDQEIIIVGAMTGYYPKEKPLSQVQIYNPGKDKWLTRGEIPEERRRGASGVVLYEGKIYVIGGITLGHTSGTNNWFDEYEITTDTWTRLPDAPISRDHFHAVVLHDKLYCIGGRNTSYHQPHNFEAFFRAVIKEIDVYDFQSGTWSTLTDSASLPVGSASGCVVCLDDRIIYFGGETDKGALDVTRAFDPSTNEWTTLNPLNQGRHGTQAIVHEGKIYVAAGSPVRGGGNINSIEIFS